MEISALTNNRIPGKIRSILILLTFNLAPAFVFGQQTSHVATQSHQAVGQTLVKHGHEEKKSEMNFADLANYFRAHPVLQLRQEPENEADDDDAKPQRTQVLDASLIHYRTATPANSPRSAFSPAPPTLPISPTAADTFESSSDPGTLIPPDTHGAVDSNYAVTAINSVIRIQTRAGGAVSVVNLNSFWTSLISTGTFYDPRIHYDPSINRWICVTDWGPQATNSSLLIAVSKTSNPTGGWWMYKVLVDVTGVNWLDYPNVGFNGKWLVITGNLFTVSGSTYAGAATFVFNKANLASGTGASYTGFSNTSSFTIAPAITYDAAEQNLFMVESWWGQAPGGGQMQLWKIAGAVGSETMTSLGFPASSGFNWQGQSNAVSGTGGADFVPQLGTSSLIQANDDRVTQMIQMNNKLWFAHEVFLPYSTTANPTRVSVLWWQIDTLGTPSQIGLIDDPSSSNNKFYTFPTIAVNTSNDALVGFSVTSNQMHPSAGYALRIHTDPVDSIRPVFTYRHGQNTYFKNFGGARDRWGDYSATCLDPLNQTDFWTIQEVSNAAVNTWDTWWAHVPTCATPPAITGILTVCTGLTTALTDATSGGTWTSSSANATVGSTTGLVTGVTTGTAIISYAVAGGCFTSVIVTVNPSAVAGTISGPSAVCIGNNMTLTDAAAGGIWSSTSTANATIGTSGIVLGVAAGTTTISYAVTNSCGSAVATLVVSVSTAPSAGTVSGTGVLCVGANTTLTDATTGGSWSSGTPSVATVGSTGIVLGVTGGTATISYGVTNICTAYATTVVTVNPLPNAGIINGANSVCTGANITLTNAVSGGTWTSGAPSTASVGSTGIVTGVALGTATISYGVTNSCGTLYATAIISVNSLPAAGTITGTAQVCAGASVSLTDAVTGGTWSSGTTAVGTIGSTTGVATGITSGTSIITYTVSSGTGCYNTTTAILTVNALPVVASISGTANVCIGGTATLSDATSGGTWTSSSTSVATVGSTGIVTGVAAGTSTISYKVTNVAGCTGSATKVATVNAVPTVTLGTNPSVGTGVVKGFLSFTVTGSPNAYNLAYSSAAHTAGFTDVTSGTVPSGLPFLITIPASPAAATYTGTITVTTAAGCASTAAPMSVTTSTTGTWRTITNLSPNYNEGGMVLLTDGTVLSKTSNGTGYGTDWDRLTPVNGSYQNGTWTTIASMTNDRLYFSEQVLPDGRFYVCGGEYGAGGNAGEIYNPKTNSWSPTGGTGFTFPNTVSDANSELLFNGQILQASVDESGVNWNYLYDPVANTYTRTANCLRVDNEAVWVKLPDSSVLFLDNYGTTSERFMPKTNTWINDGICPVNLYDPYGSEAGAGYTLPDGRVFFIGSTPTTAYYTPSGTTAPGTWAAGPALPLNLGAADAASAMLPNGKILLMLSPTPTSANHFPGPTYYYEFDYTTNIFTEVTAPAGGDTSSNSCFISNTLDLPDGCVMFVNQGYSRYYEYVPVNAPLAAGQPTISTITRKNCDSFSITGTLFNGITEGAAYGDDWQMSTNYPIVRLTSGTNVYYATTYNWNRIGAVMTGALPDTATFALPAGIPVGTYSVQVVVNGNPSANFTLNTSLAISPATASVCAGNNVTLTDAATTGVWSSANSSIATVGTNGLVTGVAAGTTTISYAINQCFATATITVNALPTATTSQTNVSCFGGSNGTATVTASGGSGSYSYAWLLSGGSAPVASGLSANTYSCVVTDSRGCAVVKVVTITQPAAALTATTGQANVPCFGGANGTATVTASGGTTSYTYAWAPSGGTAATASGLVAGTYTCTITDAHSCTYASVVSITQPSTAVTATTSQTNVSCNGGSNGTASVSASGGTPSYTYAWSPSGGTASSASGLTGITYTCTITDANNCTLNKVVSITQPSTAVTATTSQTNVSCNGGSNGTASVSASGGTPSYTYAWSPSGGTASSASGLTAITYTCTITDANNCTLNKVVSITQPSTAVTATTSQTNVSCNGGSNGTASVSASGGTPSYTYAWSPSGGTASSASGLTAITYTCTITDANSCTLNKVVSITQPSTAVTATTSQTNVSCNGGSNGTASVSASGGTPSYSYAWSPSGGTASSASGLTGITYTCTITDANNCALNKVVSITQPSTAVTATTSQTNVSCNGGSNGTASVSASGGTPSYTYTWSPSGGSAATATGLSAGTYSCTVSDANGCSVVKTFTITAPSALAISLGANPTVSYGTTSTAITYSVISGSPISYAMTYDAAAHTAGFTDVTTTTLVPSSIALAIPAGAAAGIYNGSITVSNGSCTSTGNAFSISISGGGNIPPVFTGGSLQSLNICQDAGATNINSLLTVSDADAGQTETWTVVTSPSNGSLSGFSTIASSGSASITPTGLTYTPGTGYSGTDVFVIQVSDAAATAMTTINVTVGASATAIAGATSLCAGTGTTLSDAVAGGIWTSSAPTIISVSATGSVNALSAGTATISYATSCGAAATLTVTALPTPTSINGASSVCTGSGISLTDNITGGTWSSSNPATGTINATSGSFIGLGAGTTTISYTTGCGTAATYTVTAVPPVAAISGATTVCQGSTTQLTDAIPGGTWTSSNPSVGSVDGTGLVTGISGGSLGLSYYDGCGVPITVTVNVTPIPVNITRRNNMCASGLDTLADVTPGGTWSSSAPGIATIDPATGIITAGPGSGGIIIISYSTGCGTPATYPVTVNPIPDAGTITGTNTVCTGSITNLTDAASGGVWSSGSPSIATVSSGGTVTGVAAGTASISYSVTNGCGVSVATYPVTVNTVSAGTISGLSNVNIGSSITLSDAVAGGTWSASNGNATVSAGLVTGVSAGTVVISYAVTNGCGTATATKVITVNTSTVAGITGAPSVCVGLTTALTDATTGGTWSSSNTFIATVGTSGIVTGIAAGTATISYTVSGIPATIVVTVNANPSSIGGATAVCAGSSIPVSDFTAGGNWTSTANVSVVSTGSTTGLVTGLSAGTSLITYSLSTGCYKTYAINVNAAPAPISGTLLVCAGATTFVSDVTGGGVSWTSGTTSVATISASGVVTGVSAGTTIITYTISSGCRSTAIVTVTAAPGAITGNTPLCQGATMTLSDATTGGTWTSNNTDIAMAGSSSGIVTGISGGNATITYSTGGSGCTVMTVVTINPLPNAGTITGVATVCTGSTTTVSDAMMMAGGVWSSSATSVATVASTGVVTGAGTGTATISYTLTNSCGAVSATLVVTVSPSGSAGTITGTPTLCASATTDLTDAVTGGTWNSGATSVATVSSTGTVTGVATGTAIISYSVAGGCGAAIATMTVTVSSVTAGTISGASVVYTGASITLSDAVSGGTWNASNGNATVSGGLVTGVSVGTVVISYSVTNGCGTATATKTVTVNAGVTPITGPGLVCIGTTTPLTDATSGGTWSSSNTFIATVGTSGIVTGVAVGTATISYTVAGISATTVVTVSTNPSSIGGATSVCIGSSISVSDFTAGGTWTSSGGVSIVSTGSTTAMVTGVTAGTSTITYSLGTGCFKTYAITVKPLPTAILGNLSICGAGNVTFLSDATAGTSWTISPVTTATVSASGRVYGVAAGTATVTYTGSNACYITATATVNTLVTVAAISGATNVSSGATISLSDATVGGIWSSSNPALGSVDALGNVTGVGTSGTVTISYALTYGSGCVALATKPITVHTPGPQDHGGTTASGTTILNAGETVVIADDVTGSDWSSGDNNVATVNMNGAVTGVSAGFANITHTGINNNGDASSMITPIIVNAHASSISILPNPNNGTFTIKGKLASAQSDEVALKITDMLGQVIYKSTITAQEGTINEQVKLNSNLANGMYLLNMKSGNENMIFHFVVEK